MSLSSTPSLRRVERNVLALEGNPNRGITRMLRTLGVDPTPQSERPHNVVARTNAHGICIRRHGQKSYIRFKLLVQNTPEAELARVELESYGIRMDAPGMQDSSCCLVLFTDSQDGEFRHTLSRDRNIAIHCRSMCLKRTSKNRWVVTDCKQEPLYS